jgi:hypothetical protein
VRANVQQVKQQLADTLASVTSLYIEYKSAVDDEVGKPRGGYLHRVVACSAGHFLHWSAKGTDGYSSREDPIQQRACIIGDVMIAEYPSDRVFRTARVAANDPLPGSLPREFMFAVVGWWPCPGRPAPRFRDDAPLVLCDVARSPAYRLRPEQELVGDRWCHVLEVPGKDRLWLDGDRAWAMMARELLGEDGRTVIQRVELSEHQQVKPGIWVPKKIRNLVWDDLGRKVTDAVLLVQEVQVNDPLPDSLFDAQMKPGSVEITDDGTIVQRVPGGTDLLDEIVDWQGAHSALRKAQGTFSAQLEIAVETAVGGICIVYIAVSHWRRRSRQQVPKR